MLLEILIFMTRSELVPALSARLLRSPREVCESMNSRMTPMVEEARLKSIESYPWKEAV